MTPIPAPAGATELASASMGVAAQRHSAFAARVWRDLMRAAAIALVPSLAIIWWFFWPTAGLTDRFGYLIGRDFINFWFAAHLAITGRVSEIYDLAAYHAAMRAEMAATEPFMNFSYLPNALPILAPIGLLPWALAYPLWLASGAIAFLFAALGGDWRNWAARDVLLVLAAPISILVVGVAQATFFLALLLVAGFRLLPSRPIAAGVLFGLLSVKPQLGVLLPLVLIARGEWRTIAAAAMTSLGLALASVALFGVQPWHQYLAETAPYQSRVIWEPFGFIWTLLTSPYAFLVKIGVPVGPAMILHGFVALAVTVLLLVSARRARDPSAVATLTALAAVIVSPYATSYDLALPCAALLWWLSGEKQIGETWQRIAIAAFWGAPAIVIGLAVLHVPLAAPVLLAAFAAVMARANDKAEGPAEIAAAAGRSA